MYEVIDETAQTICINMIKIDIFAFFLCRVSFYGHSTEYCHKGRWRSVRNEKQQDSVTLSDPLQTFTGTRFHGLSALLLPFWWLIYRCEITVSKICYYLLSPIATTGALIAIRERQTERNKILFPNADRKGNFSIHLCTKHPTPLLLYCSIHKAIFWFYHETSFFICAVLTVQRHYMINNLYKLKNVYFCLSFVICAKHIWNNNLMH